jgi:ankyrin repeat protein
MTDWPALERHVAVVHEWRASPDVVGPCDEPADEFLRLACLVYGADEPGRWAAARALRDAHPGLASTSIHVAAAEADLGAIRRLLAADHSGHLASGRGGPFGWEPLLYLTYARHRPDVAADDVTATVRLLLENGADPDAGYLWHGLVPPFTALTGAFGEGEGGPVNQPRHPHALALARQLLEAGADPNDGQALYNRMFEPDDDHLELLFAFGLGGEDGRPWRRRLGSVLESPTAMLRGQLHWAVTHGLGARARLLAAHGVDVSSPLDDGRTATDHAALSGEGAMVDDLIALGAPPPALTPAETVVAAVMRGDVAAARAVGDAAVADARAQRPGLMAWAASRGGGGAVVAAADLGWDVNGRGRRDAPVEHEWETALHVAAGDGDVELVRLLLALGADPNRRDARFDAPPLGWARYFGQAGTAAVLEPVTAAEPSD